MVSKDESYHVRIISYANHSHYTPPLTPPRLRGGETKRSFGGVGFFGFNKQSSGHDISAIAQYMYNSKMVAISHTLHYEQHSPSRTNSARFLHP
ncbi:hypothetical protein [Nostoc sp. JL33]|uniref:hypothetical protein n=1 Tax=Nostoc sp. JL33 TaxID=2815396 RepID=UPI0025DA8171|nr:hypothetical protein [Nostoc sp. JL33]